MTRPCTMIPSAELEAQLETVLAGIASGIGSLGLPSLEAVVLGGGYGRGEGGVLHTPQGDRFYNDLDFFVFASGADASGLHRIDSALKGISEQWERKLGIAVDFGPAKNLEKLGGVAETLMFQELLHGWRPVWGNIDLAKWIPSLEPAEIPLTEAVRLLLNRGMGLVFAGEYLRSGKDDPDFIVRNMNKAVLGSGDALLIDAGSYRWRCSERAETFRALSERENLPGEYAGLYERAVRYKMEPEPILPPDPAGTWRTCRSFFLDAVRRVAGVSGTASAKDVSAGLSRRAKRYRSFKNLLRWLRRTGKVRFSGMCDAPVVTVLGLLYAELSSSGEPIPCPPGLRRLWEVFN